MLNSFPAIYFTYGTRYPQSGNRLELSRSYVYTSEAEAPDQRTFILQLTGMQYFLDGADAADRVTQPGRNMWVFEDFYILHRLSKSFLFEHPIHGSVVCKFNRPLEVPEGIPNGKGVLPPITVELLEIP